MVLLFRGKLQDYDVPRICQSDRNVWISVKTRLLSL